MPTTNAEAILVEKISETIDRAIVSLEHQSKEHLSVSEYDRLKPNLKEVKDCLDALKFYFKNIDSVSEHKNDTKELRL